TRLRGERLRDTAGGADANLSVEHDEIEIGARVQRYRDVAFLGRVESEGDLGAGLAGGARVAVDVAAVLRSVVAQRRQSNAVDETNRVALRQNLADARDALPGLVLRHRHVAAARSVGERHGVTGSVARITGRGVALIGERRVLTVDGDVRASSIPSAAVGG